MKTPILTDRRPAFLKILLLAGMILVGCWPVSSNARPQKYNIEQALLELDAAVTQYPHYEAQRMQEIDKKKQELSHALFDNDRYLIMKQIYALYTRLNADSAISYINNCMTLAEKCQRNDWRLESLLARATLHFHRGDLLLSRNDFMEMGRLDNLPAPLRVKTAASLCSYYRTFKNNRLSNTSEYRKELLEKLDVDWKHLPDNYLKDDIVHYYRGKSYVDTIAHEDLDKIKAIFEEQTKKGEKINVLGHILANMYKERGDTEAYKYYLIRTATLHLQAVYKCADAMLSILSSDWILENPERAFNYARLYSSDINSYNDTYRSVKVIGIQNNIVQSFIHEKDRLNTALLMAFLASIAFCTLIIVLFVKLRHRITKIKELNGRIERRNQSLAENLKTIEAMSKKLHVSYVKLQDEIKLRDRNFMDTYLMCSNYIKIHQNFKKSIINLLKTNSIPQAMKMASSKDISETEKKEFYQKFDRAFFCTHPDFVERFNQLLRPEHRYILHPDGDLSHELRIYALISLGINNSVSIAEFLHYSPQTIYNYRLRMRHQACIPEKVFAEAVGQLYDDNKLKEYLTLSNPDLTAVPEPE